MSMPQDMFDLLKELGLFTLPVPEQYGGSDSLLSSCIALEELGRVCYNTAYLLLDGGGYGDRSRGVA